MTEVTTDLAKLATALEAVKGDHSEKIQFPNGHGVSIIRNEWSYGHTAGKFEVAVLDADGDLDYSTPVTDDVVGWLDVQGVLDVMQQVAALPAADSVEAALATLGAKRDRVQAKLAAARLEVEELQRESADLTGDILQLEAGM
jgi:hypothetical protein